MPFDGDRLRNLLMQATIMLRKGEAVEQRTEGGLEITEVFPMPHVSEARPGLELVDLEMVVVGVDKAIAEPLKPELLEILRQYPEPDSLGNGPSYIAVGGVLGHQDLALRLFAVGKVLKLWGVVTPKTLGATEAEQRLQLARSGYVMITGWKAAADGGAG